MEKMKGKWKEKDPKLKCSSSPTPLYGFRRATWSYQHNPYQAPFSKKSPKSLVLVLHGADVQEIAFSGCLNTRWHQLTSSLLLGKAATEGQPHMDHQYICWASWPSLSFHAAETRIKVLFFSPLLSYLVRMTKDQWYDTSLQSSYWTRRDRSPMKRVNIAINYPCLQAS